MNKVLTAFSAVSLFALCACAETLGRHGPSPSSLTPVARWQGSFSSVTKPEEEIVTDAGAWAALWRKIGQAAPNVDMSRSFAVAVFLGTRPTGGYGVVFLPPSIEQGEIVIAYREKKPSGMTFEALTQPYAVQLYPKTGLPVRLENAAGEKTRTRR